MTPLLERSARNLVCDPGGAPSEDQLAAAAFLARYSGRTLEAYRYDLRYFFHWASTASRCSPRPERR